MKLPRFIVSVDTVIFAYWNGVIYIPLYKRSAGKSEPYVDCWSLAGGPLQESETPEEACRRKLEEDLGLKVRYLEQLYTFADPDRDPRNRVVSIAYFALIRLADDPTEREGEHWVPISQLPAKNWAFDHKRIVQTAVSRLKAKVTYEPLGVNLLEREFSMPQLQSLYEAVLEYPLDRRNFAKKIHSYNLLIPTKTVSEGRGRPTQLYRFDTQQFNRLQKEGFVFEL